MLFQHFPSPCTWVHLYETGMQFATTGMNECLPRKLKSLKNILAATSLFFWKTGRETKKNCHDQELVSKSVEISSKFGEIWQEIVTKCSFLFCWGPKFGAVPSTPHHPKKKVWMEPKSFAFCSFILCCSCPTWSISNLSMKEGSFFGVMRSTKPGCFRLCSWCLWKALTEEECMGLVLCCLDLRCKSSWILNDFFTEN